MKTNITTYIQTNKRTILIAVASLAMCLVVAAVVYAGLRMLSPRKTESQAKSSSNPTSTATSKEQLAKEADALFKTGDDALKVGDAKKGIESLKKAQILYEKLGDVMKVEEIKDQISLAEYSLSQASQQPAPEKIEDKGKAVKAS